MSYTDSELGRLIGGYESTRDRYWLTRHYIAASTLVTLLLAAFAPGSVNAQAFAGASSVAQTVVMLLALLSLTALYESFVTAFVPRTACAWIRSQRHLVYMGIALGQLCMAYAVLAYAPDAAALILRFALDATVAALVAFLDLFARHKAGRIA